MYYNVRARSGQEGDLTNNAPTTNSPTQYYSNVNAGTSGYYAGSGQSNLNGPFSVGHALPLHSPQLYTEEASIGVQHQLPWGIVLDVAYVGTFTKHASAYYPINEVPYSAEFAAANQYVSAVNSGGQATASSILPDNFFRPYPGFGRINSQIFNLTANYNSLQTRVTRRFSNGLEFGVAYTYAKALGLWFVLGCNLFGGLQLYCRSVSGPSCLELWAGGLRHQEQFCCELSVESAEG